MPSLSYLSWIKLKFTLVCLFLVSACSSIPKEQVDTRLAAWQGKDINTVIQFWGLPTKQQEVDDQRYAQWLNKKSEKGNTAVSVGTGTSGRRSSIGIGLTLFELGGSEEKCERLLTYDSSGKVTKIKWQGDHSYCLELTPDYVTVMAKRKANEE